MGRLLAIDQGTIVPMIENYRTGFADAIYYNNAPSQIAEDAAARWGYEITTLFAQDEFELGDHWTIVCSLNY